MVKSRLTTRLAALLAGAHGGSASRPHSRGRGLRALALVAGLGGAVAACPSDAMRCAFVIVNVGTGAGQPPEDGTPVTLQQRGGQRMFLSMVGGTFTYGAQRDQTQQCVPLPLGDESVIAFTVKPVPSGEATLRVDLLGQSGSCTGGVPASAGGGDVDAGLDPGCSGDLLDNKVIVFVAPVSTTASSASGAGTGGAAYGGTGGATSSSASSSGNGGSDGG